ncbi:MAG: Gfo/Idh/MocA family oxidoreductase [Oligoflexia bacterium]|nr:Gfo/Idh/MocA family oxidoreductase [Oligoflexia bacterium]
MNTIDISENSNSKLSIPSIREREVKKLKGAIIGFGFIAGNGHWPSYKKRLVDHGDVEIIAICDLNIDRLRIAQQNGLNSFRTYYDYRDLIDKEKYNIDFIDIATPPYAHADIIEYALKNGLHVLCEKPLVTKSLDAEMLIELAQREKRVLFPVHNYKHAPIVKAIREIIGNGDGDGKIGRVKSVTINTFRNTHARGVLEWNTNWRRDNKYSGGGIAMDHGSHSLYLLFEWLKSYPTSITASASASTSMSTLSSENEDDFFATLHFANAGLAQINLTWNAGVRKVIYTIQGTKGAITVEDDKMEVATMRECDDQNQNFGYASVNWHFENYNISSKWMDSSHIEWFNSLFEQFKLAIIEHDYLNKEIIDAYRCIKVIESAYNSANNESKKEIISYLL